LFGDLRVWFCGRLRGARNRAAAITADSTAAAQAFVMPVRWVPLADLQGQRKTAYPTLIQQRERETPGNAWRFSRQVLDKCWIARRK
jgi:hypothetical protein